jgi:Holliday junction resolvase
LSKGIVRERQVMAVLRAEGWVVYRAAGSHGHADLVALRAGDPPRLVQVKGTAGGPWEHFGPAERAALIAEAVQAGAVAMLCWWPPRRPVQWIGGDLWPRSRLRAELA